MNAVLTRRRVQNGGDCQTAAEVIAEVVGPNFAQLLGKVSVRFFTPAASLCGVFVPRCAPGARLCLG